MVQKIKDFWKSLPHWLQAIAVTFASAASSTIVHAVVDGHFQWNVANAKHLVWTAVVAGIIAARAFYMQPSWNGKGRRTDDSPPVPPSLNQGGTTK